jgi:uncharacterized protein
LSEVRIARIWDRLRMTDHTADSRTQRFAADRMLGRLARTLRLLGYDTAYSPGATPETLRKLAQKEGRTILTRGEIARRFPGIEKILSLKSENPTQQLREVVKHLRLDARAAVFTRCTLCNGILHEVAKAEVEPEVPPKVFTAYGEFFRCAGCRHVYWRGSHVERILKNLDALLGQPGGASGTTDANPMSHGSAD